MRCTHCGSLIAQDQHRCHRCGKRLEESPFVYPAGKSAVAPALAPANAPAETEPKRRANAPARQAPLFDDRPKIIPFESITERKVGARRQTRIRRQAQASAAAERTAQPPLDLRAPAPRQKTAVSDDVPVAQPGARLHAAALDGIFLACGVAVAAGAFYAMGGRVALTAKAALPCGIALAGLAMFYHLFWCMLGRESAGARCVGLRTMTFDGHRPSWQRRVARFVLACFSVSAVGIGVLWALVDDEGLTWHDHITKTFLTEYDPNPSSTRRQ